MVKKEKNNNIQKHNGTFLQVTYQLIIKYKTVVFNLNELNYEKITKSTALHK